MAQRLERLKKWKKYFLYMAEKIKLCFGRMRRNVKRVVSVCC